MSADDRTAARRTRPAADATLDATDDDEVGWSPRAGDVLADRYELLDALGAGAHGSVFEAHDRRLGGPVAVKIVQGVTADQRLRLRREFRTVADAAHPNVVMLYELHADDETAFFTMELVRGVDFMRWVRPQGKLDEARLRDALGQLVRGLAALHAFGLLHRDLKPGNVLVRTDDGRVKLVDFGLARRGDAAAADDIAGTPLYMSPEQAAGAPLGPASDVYALGVMLHEALTGHTPFADLSGLALLAAKQMDLPVTLGDDSSLPADLARLAVDLLAVQPDARPDTRAIVRRLGLADPPSPWRPLQAGFFGRQEALRALDHGLRRLERGDDDTTVVVVEGPAGYGKTALVDHFTRRLHARGGYEVLHARCFERESVPHKGLDDLVDRVRARLHEGPRLHVAGGAALVALFPVLGDVIAVEDAAPADPVERRRRAVEALRDVLDHVAGDRLLVVCLEDLHWFDRDSAEIVERLVRRDGAVPTLFVATTREAVSRAGSELAEHLQAAGAEHVTLGGLDRGALAQVVRAALLEARLDPEAAERVVDTVAGQADGSPLLALELAREAVSSPPGPRGGVDLDEVVARRVHTLEPEPRRLLETIALAGGPLPLQVVLEAAEVRAAETLALLRGRGFVRTEGLDPSDPVHIAHDRVGSSIAAAVAEAHARAIHRRLAVALSRAGGDPRQAAYHHEHAGAAELAADAYAASARRALASSAYNGAARLYARAIALGRDPAKVAAWMWARAEALADAGLSAESGRAYLQALAHAGPHDDRVLRQRAAEQLLRAGKYQAGIEHLAVVMRDLGLPTPGSAAGALAGLAWGRVRVRWRGVDFEPRAAGRIDARSLARVDACWAAATGLLQANVIVGQDYQTRHLRLALDAGEPVRVARALAVESLYAATVGDAEAATARAHLQRARALARAHHDPYSAALAAIAQGGAAVYRGRFAAALAPLEEADTLLRAHGRDVAWELSMVSTFRVMSHWYRGDMAAMLAALHGALADARAREDVHTAIMLRVAYGPLAHLVAGDLDAARRELSDCRRDLPDHLRHSTYRYVELLTRTRLCRYAGDGAGALAAFAPPAGRVGMALLLQRAPMQTFYEHDRGTAALAAAVADVASTPHAPRVAEQSVAALVGQGTAWAMAMARPIRAGLAIVRRDPERARAELVRAEQDFEALGMNLYALAMRYRRAELDADVAELAAVERRIAGLGVAEPGRMVDLVAAPIRTGPRPRGRRSADRTPARPRRPAPRSPGRRASS